MLLFIMIPLQGYKSQVHNLYTDCYHCFNPHCKFRIFYTHKLPHDSTRVYNSGQWNCIMHRRITSYISCTTPAKFKLIDCLWFNLPMLIPLPHSQNFRKYTSVGNVFCRACISMWAIVHNGLCYQPRAKALDQVCSTEINGKEDN
jgi:hypothetical protein